jgi:hypothetical protein
MYEYNKIAPPPRVISGYYEQGSLVKYAHQTNLTFHNNLLLYTIYEIIYYKLRIRCLNTFFILISNFELIVIQTLKT